MLPISLNVSLSQSEIEDENFICSSVQSNTKIIRLNISVDKVSVVDILNSGNHLINEHKNGFQGELSESLIK